MNSSDSRQSSSDVMRRVQDVLPIAIEAIEIGRHLIHTRPPHSITAKADRDMVSDVDYAVEQAVREQLRKATPDIDFLGEEEGKTTDGSELLWVLDPIDGTANFIRGIPLCGISLGLIHQSRRVPILGIIDLPFLGARYTAVENNGAHINNQRIRTSTTNKIRNAIVALGDYAVGHDAAGAANLHRLAITTELAAAAQRVRMLGSAAIDLAWVAEGKLDACISLSNKPWDTAAGVILAREAGAIVTDSNGSRHTTTSTATIAANPGLINDILRMVTDTNPASHDS